MDMTHACWNIPDSFGTSTLLLWITSVSIYQNVLLWGQLPSAFITILMILCVSVSGKCRYFITHYLNSQIFLLHYLKILKNVFLPVKWESFTHVCFKSEVSGGVVLGLASRWRSFHGLLPSSSPSPMPHSCPSSVCLMLPLMRELPAQTSFHSTEGEHMLEIY